MFGNRTYLDVDFSKGFPVGRSIFYECKICGQSFSSRSLNSTPCKCGNFSIDVDAGRISVKDESKLKVFEK